MHVIIEAEETFALDVNERDTILQMKHKIQVEKQITKLFFLQPLAKLGLYLQETIFFFVI